MKGWLVTVVLFAAACGSANEARYVSALPAPRATIPVFSGPAPWAYRLGPEVYASESVQREVILTELASAGIRQGCDAVVMARLPESVAHEGGINDRPWGICAFRVAT